MSSTSEDSMSAHIRAFDAADESAVARLFQIRSGAIAAVSALALLLAGCSDPPRLPVAGADPADPGARTPPVGYRSTVGSYKSQRPADPTPWGEQNERVAPAPKPGQ
jgi:hypothetical protein